MGKKSKLKKPPKWIHVYPQGTKDGDEEQSFFIALARHPKYTWRSTAALAKEAGLSKERVEEIAIKYYNKKMVLQNPKNEDQWGYWERNLDELEADEGTVVQKDHESRIDKSINPDLIKVDWGKPVEVECTVHVQCPSSTPKEETEYWFAPNGPNRGNVPDITDVFQKKPKQKTFDWFEEPKTEQVPYIKIDTLNDVEAGIAAAIEKQKEKDEEELGLCRMTLDKKQLMSIVEADENWELNL
jgi:hypothetical protein